MHHRGCSQAVTTAYPRQGPLSPLEYSRPPPLVPRASAHTFIRMLDDFICVRCLRLLGVYPGLLWDRALRSYRTAPQGRGGVSPGGQSEGLQCPARWGNKNTKLDEAPSNLALTPQSFCTDLSTPLAHRAENFTRPLLPGALLRNRDRDRARTCSRMGSPNSHSLRTPSDDGPVDQRATGHTVSVSRD